MLASGIERIYKEDLEAQKHYINLICKEVRNMDSEILFKVNAFFVPNAEYMKEFFGSEILLPNYDCYDYYGTCKWTGHLVIPIKGVDGKIKGFTGYNPAVTLAKRDGQEDDPLARLAKYKESSKALMDKSRFFLCPLGFDKAMKDGYIIVIDGVFDALNVASFGFNTLSVLGSTLTDEILFCLSFIDVVYVAHDNDQAGLNLYNAIKMKLPKVYFIRQSKCKDIDEFIKLYPNEFKSNMQKIFSKFKSSITLSLNNFNT